MPLGSSSAAPVMSPGPNCLTRGLSAMLLSRLTIAILQNRTWSPMWEKGWKSEDQDRREPNGSSPLRLPHSAGRRFGGSKALSSQSAGAAHAALTTTYTTTHKDDLCHHNFREDRPASPMCKAIYSGKANAPAWRGRPLAHGRSLGLGHFGDYLVRDIARHRLIMRELHGVGGTAPRHAAQLSDIAEHFRQRHVRHDGDVGAALQLVQDRAAAPIDVADHVAQVIPRRDSLDLHDRLQQDRAGFANGFAEAGLGGYLEGECVGIDIVEAAVDQRRAEIHRRVVGEHAVFFLNLEALFDRGYELPRHRAAHGFVHEFESGAARQRLENHPHLGELPATPRLLLMDVLFGQFLGESLAVRNLRLSHEAV